MGKTYHFMAGLPRSGSTVLSALLNQHPDIYASPQTDLIGLLYEVQTRIPSYESYKAGLFQDGYENILRNMANNFYSQITKPVIIDKNRGWGTPYNFDNISPYVNKDGKVIITMRPILEVLASFAKVMDKTEKKMGYLPYLDEGLWVSGYRNKKDAQIESIMQLNEEMDRAIYSVANLLKNHRERALVIWFDDLVASPQETMDRVSDFLDLKKHEYNFDSILEVDKHDDLAGYGIIGLHDLKPRLEKPNTDPDNYLSKYIIEKYKNALDFILETI